jgi:ubiquinone/menaquinone biosynthesis C-methylase UbiE
MPDTNADQIAYWNESGGPVWVALQTLLDRQLAPFSDEVIRVLQPREGEQVLDVGCGCGATSLLLAERVGAGGGVLGVDISAPMLDVARNAASARGARCVSFREADAESADLGRNVFDAVFSRFGVMFFADPVAAFRNIRQAAKPGGRLGFVCWRRIEDNPWMNAPLAAALPYLPPIAPADPLAPGPFAFADGDRLRGILHDAGFTGIAIERFDTQIGGNTLDDSLRLAVGMGPLGKALRENLAARPQATEAVHRVLQNHKTPDGIFLGASTWTAIARA